MEPGTSADVLVPLLFHYGIILALLGVMLWFITGIIGGRGMAKRIFLWGAMIIGLSMLGVTGLTKLGEAFGALPEWFAIMLIVVIIGFMLLGAFSIFARFFMTSAAADAMTGELAAGLVKAVLVPFRGLLRIVQRLIRQSWLGP